MANRIKTYIASPLLMLLFMACSGNDVTDMAQTSDGMTGQISFNVRVASSGDDTRGYSAHSGDNFNEGYTWSGNEDIGISLNSNINSTDRSSSTDDIKLFKYDKANSKLAAVGQPFYWLSSSETVTDIRVWSYGTSGNSQEQMKIDPMDHEFTLEPDQRTTAQGNEKGAYVKELLYGVPKKNITFTTDEQKIDLYHQCSRIVVRVVRDNTADPKSTEMVTKVTDAWVGTPTDAAYQGAKRYVPTKATFGAHRIFIDQEYGTWTGQETTTNEKTVKNDIILMRRESASDIFSASQTEVVYSAVIIPGTYAGGLPIFTVKTTKSYRNPDNTATIADDYYAYTPVDAKTYNPGTQYNYTLTMKDTKVLVDLQVTEWGSGSDLSATFNNDGDYTVGGVNFKMIPVGAGTAKPKNTNGVGTLEINVSEDFQMAETEVTQALYAQVTGGTAPEATDAEKAQNGVKYNEWVTFVTKLNQQTVGQRPAGWVFAIPTRTQWRYAAAGGKYSQGFLYSGSDDMTEVAHCNDSEGGPIDVKSKKANELGLYDMSGNVWEWTTDGTDVYVCGHGYWWTALLLDTKRACPADEGVNETGSSDYGCGLRLALVREAQPAAPVVGDLYFSDGSWGTLTANSSGKPKTAADVIGMVFSTTTSPTDQKLGYTHGYVMALKGCGSYPFTTANAPSQVTDKYVTTGQAMADDLDGLTHCLEARRKAEASTTYSMEDLPAINAAFNYGNKVPAPSTSSGWYLPSSGQWKLFIHNISGKTYGAGVEGTGYNINFDGNGTAAALDAYMSSHLPAGVPTADYASASNNGDEPAWFTSTEYSSTHFVRCVVWSYSMLQTNHDFTAKTYGGGINTVRPVLAF